MKTAFSDHQRIMDPSRVLEELWIQRHVGRVDESYEGYIQLCIRYDLHPRLSLEERWSFAKKIFSISELIDFFCLEASFCRRREENEKALKIFEFLSGIAEAAIHFQWHFQKGLQALHLSKFTDGKNAFYLAKRYARSELEKTFSAINHILCLEALGYDYDSELKEFATELSKNNQEVWSPTLVGVSRALQLRAFYRGGQSREIRDLLQSDEKLGDQATYFMLWLEELPYFAFPKPDQSRLLQLQSLKDSYHIGYRIRTIMGCFLPEDLKDTVRPCEHIQRLYLWTWRWLVNPDTALLSKVLRLRDFILQDSTGGSLTAEDCLMLENCLRWLGLFSGQLDNWIKPLATMKSDPCNRYFPYLDFERRIIDIFYYRSIGNNDFDHDIRSVLSESSVFTDDVCRLSELIESKADKTSSSFKFTPLEKLRVALHSLSVPHDQNLTTFPQHSDYQIDLRTGVIAFKSLGSAEIKTVSEQLSILIHTLIRSNLTIKVQDIIKDCFYANRYQPDIHDQRLSRLLSRAQKTFRPYSFQRRESTIICDVKSDRFTFVNDSDHVRQLRENIRGFDYPLVEKHRVKNSKVKPQTVRSDLSGWISRKDLEEATGLAKSSLVRKINHWVECGHIEKRGIGKSTSYRLGKEFQLHSSHLFRGENIQ